MSRDPSVPGITHVRLLPDAVLAEHVAHFWEVRWSLSSPHVAETLPHPQVHLVIEQRGRSRSAVLAIPHAARFRRELRGNGRVFGVKFRPAMFPIAGLRGHEVAVSIPWGAEAEDWARRMGRTEALEDRIQLATQFLASRLPAPSRETARLRDLVERMAVDRTLVRVRDVARVARMDVRTLERAFRRHVGPSPKWVLTRYRLHEAAEALGSASPPSLAALAADLGYADQAHFAREFRRFVGRTPREFSRERTGPRDATSLRQQDE